MAAELEGGVGHEHPVDDLDDAVAGWLVLHDDGGARVVDADLVSVYNGLDLRVYLRRRGGISNVRLRRLYLDQRFLLHLGLNHAPHHAHNVCHQHTCSWLSSVGQSLPFTARSLTVSSPGRMWYDRISRSVPMLPGWKGATRVYVCYGNCMEVANMKP